jgi:Gas vesicle synthesis protein GvpL/GvpF
MSDERGIWAYAITEHGAGTDVSWLAGVAGTQVRTATGAGLTVLVSDVDLAEFGEAALRRNLEDLDWLEGVARAHHAVIDAASKMFPVLPTRLATVYSSDETMAAVLDGRRQELLAAMRRVGGRVEWGVKAYAVPESEQPEAGRRQRAPAEGGAPADAGGRGAGLAYLKRRKEQLSARAESQRSAAAGARAVHGHLSGHAAEASLHPPQSSQLSGDKRPMMLNAAYLVDADDGTGFVAEVAAVADEHPELDLNLTGPWPPYSFTGEEGG